MSAQRYRQTGYMYCLRLRENKGLEMVMRSDRNDEEGEERRTLVPLILAVATSHSERRKRFKETLQTAVVQCGCQIDSLNLYIYST